MKAIMQNNPIEKRTFFRYSTKIVCWVGFAFGQIQIEIIKIQVINSSGESNKHYLISPDFWE